MEKIRVGVIGVGHLGSSHAKIYREIESAVLTGVCDLNRERLLKIAGDLDVEGFCDYRQLFGKVDAVSVATTTKEHYKIALDFLKNNIHLLVEKPFTTCLKEADALIKTAQKNKLILQVGHVERFNAAFAATQKIIQEPKFIECHRLSPFPHRSLDVGAVLDLMIHDIDIILGLVCAKIKKIESVGVNVLTPFEDIANCRITFKNGCVVNLTCSRVSEEVMRKIRIFQRDAYISLDYKEAKASVYKRSGNSIVKEELPIEREEPLKKELESFISCVAENKPPLVSGGVAREALAVALEIQKQIWRKNKSCCIGN